MTTNEAHPIASPGRPAAPPVYPAPPRSLGGLMVSYFVVQLMVNTANAGVANFLVPLHLDALDPANNTGEPVDLGRIPAGNYMIEAKTGNYVYWKKVKVTYPAAPVAKKKRR